MTVNDHTSSTSERPQTTCYRVIKETRSTECWPANNDCNIVRSDVSYDIPDGGPMEAT